MDRAGPRKVPAVQRGVQADGRAVESAARDSGAGGGGSAGWAAERCASAGLSRDVPPQLPTRSLGGRAAPRPYPDPDALASCRRPGRDAGFAMAPADTPTEAPK
jgi:hypothetical protein